MNIKNSVTDKDIRKEAEAFFLFHIISVHNIFILWKKE